MLSVLKPLIVVAALAYGGLVAFFYVFQPSLVYFPSGECFATPGILGLDFEDVFIVGKNGRKLHAWFVPAEGANATILHCHGNAGNITHRLELLSLLHRLGANVLLFDYQGFGQSEGSPSERNTYDDARAAFDWLVREQGVPPGRIVLHGQSLGGAVAAHLAAEVRPAGLVLESGFTSLPDLGAVLYPYVPVRLISRFKYDTAKALTRVSCPLLVIHSREDEIVPFALGQRLFTSFQGGPKRLLEIAGDHNTGFIRSEAVYLQGLRDFLSGLEPESE